MASHDEVRLPEDIERGAQGGPRFRVTRVRLASGREKRNRLWQQPLQTWDIGYGIQSQEDWEDVRDFWYARGGPERSFRFKDFSDFEITDQQIGLGDDTTTEFQVFKRYSSGGVDFDRTITKLVSGTVVVKLDGTTLTEGVDYTVDLNIGVITFTTAPGSEYGTGPGGEEVVSVTCEFDIPVVFREEQFPLVAHVFSDDMKGSIPSIPIDEIRV